MQNLSAYFCLVLKKADYFSHTSFLMPSKKIIIIIAPYFTWINSCIMTDIFLPCGHQTIHAHKHKSDETEHCHNWCNIGNMIYSLNINYNLHTWNRNSQLYCTSNIQMLGGGDQFSQTHSVKLIKNANFSSTAKENIF